MEPTPTPISDQARRYDLVVIGGGPAGLVGALVAARFGKTVALVDSQGKLGGALVNTGTAPSKTLRETALAISGVRSRRLLGVDFELRRDATVADFLRHEREVKDAANKGLSDWLRESKVDVYVGEGAFVDSHRIEVRPPSSSTSERDAAQTSQFILGDHVLIATGSSPVHPETFDFNLHGIYDSDTVLELDRIPKTLAVIGAGIIGSEYACTFAALGPTVHVIDGRDALFPDLDQEVAQAVTNGMTSSGVVFHWNERAERCEREGQDALTLTLRSGQKLTVDAVLVAAGRKSNTEALGLQAAGVELGKRGLLPVNRYFTTNVAHIHAAGDVVGPPALASTSMQQARYAISHAFGGDEPARSGLSDALPAGIYTIPEVGTMGETEKSLTDKQVDYIASRAGYLENARGRIIGDLDGFLKLLFRRDDMTLLGVHAVGEQATELVHLGMLAIRGGLTAQVLEAECFNTPTLGELYAVAARKALQQKSSASRR